ncbi:MAG: hypothetical protein CL744_06940 [Chloroflexi bacterium]|nr:hypothetical protein [Chloroflexota bacterium]
MTSPVIQETQVMVQGLEIPVWQAGNQGETVILLHGAGGSRRDWAVVMLMLSQRFRVYAPDVIGFGQSPRSDVTYTVDIFRDFVIDLMAALGIHETALIGHSLGGRISLAVAAALPDRVTRLVLAAPMGFGPVAPVGHIIATTVWAFYKAARLTPRYPKMALDPGDYESGTFEKIRQPTLLLWGSRDLYFPKSHGWRALATLPDAQLKIYNGAGHSLPIAYPVHFASDIHAFLADR